MPVSVFEIQPDSGGVGVETLVDPQQPHCLVDYSGGAPSVIRISADTLDSMASVTRLSSSALRMKDCVGFPSRMDRFAEIFMIRERAEVIQFEDSEGETGLIEVMHVSEGSQN